MKNINKYLYLVIVLLLIISLSLWIFAESTFQDFGINLCTEILGIIITVLFIERIIEINKANEQKPIVAAAYNDISLLVNRYVSFFQELYQKSVAEPEPKTIEEFMTLETINKIFENVSMSAKPHVIPETNMFSYFQNTAKNFDQLGTKILDRHGWHLDPIVYKNVHDITESFFLDNWKQMNTIQTNDTRNGWPRPQILAAYSIQPTISDLTSILFLFNWCKQTKSNLSGTLNLQNLVEYIPQLIVPEILDYRKDKNELNEEMKNWNKFQQK